MRFDNGLLDTRSYHEHQTLEIIRDRLLTNFTGGNYVEFSRCTYANDETGEEDIELFACSLNTVDTYHTMALSEEKALVWEAFLAFAQPNWENPTKLYTRGASGRLGYYPKGLHYQNLYLVYDRVISDPQHDTYISYSVDEYVERRTPFAEAERSIVYSVVAAYLGYQETILSTDSAGLAKSYFTDFARR